MARRKLVTLELETVLGVRDLRNAGWWEQVLDGRRRIQDVRVLQAQANSIRNTRGRSRRE